VPSPMYVLRPGENSARVDSMRLSMTDLSLEDEDWRAVMGGGFNAGLGGATPPQDSSPSAMGGGDSKLEILPTNEGGSRQEGGVGEWGALPGTLGGGLDTLGLGGDLRFGPATLGLLGSKAGMSALGSGPMSSFLGAQSFDDLENSPSGEGHDSVLNTAAKLKQIAKDFKEGKITASERKELKEKILKGDDA